MAQQSTNPEFERLMAQLTGLQDRASSSGAKQNIGGLRAHFDSLPDDEKRKLVISLYKAVVGTISYLSLVRVVRRQLNRYTGREFTFWQTASLLSAIGATLRYVIPGAFEKATNEGAEKFADAFLK